jgi:hypothetical protein
VTEKTRFDVFQDGKWTTVGMSVVITVTSERRLLMRIRLNLLKGLKDEDCPGIEHEYSLQPHRRPDTNKRSAHALTSPLKKAQHINTSTDATSA